MSLWHCYSWKIGKNCYPKEGELGYERPPDSKALEEACLGELVGDLDEEEEARDTERDGALEEIDGVPLAPKDVELVKAALAAVDETADDGALTALAAAAVASDDDAPSAAADADAGDAGAMDADGAEPPRAGVRRGTRVRRKPGATEQRMQDEQVKACNLVMDEKTGLRPDGQTCRVCWDACYKEDGYVGHHAVIGPDAKPCSRCARTDFGSPFSPGVYWAHLKLKYLDASKAAGNR